ncbi:GNAT family N-acetyltransferase [Streptomyces griseoviridis]|uniref:GNAT family N-acetyltransferase n=1 Tax=Streptomyces griseoviridis TaxID=45398 RepID=UPI0033D88BE9
MAEAYLRRLSRWQAEQQRDAVADVHMVAYQGATGDDHRDRRGFLDRFERQVQRTGFDMVVADGGSLVGAAYGFRLERGDDWWSGLRGGLPSEIEELTASGRAFLLAELMVRPAHRRTGVATRMTELLLARLRTDLMVAAVDRPDAPVRVNAAAETLHSWGWSKLGELPPRPAPGAADIGAHYGTDVGTGGAAGPGSGREVWVRRPPR